jgi:basic membrane lipoprotein Med (substrate-binding protein (PBP1-ABC) superfamily)
MDASMNGVGFAPANEAPVPEDVITNTQEVFDLLAVGDIVTGVDPITGELMGMQDAPTGSGDTGDAFDAICLVTDVGLINDATFNQFAYEGLLAVAEAYDLQSSYVETVSTTDYEANIGDCIDTGADAVVTVGFMMTDATSAAAALNPDISFIGVDQFHSTSLPNLVGVQFREDQAGFLAGVIAAQLSDSGTIAGIYGVEIPPVRKFRAGFEQGAKYINPDIEVLGEYIPDFVAPELGAEAAERFIEQGADVVFGAGGLTGSGGIVRAAELGAWVIGVDQDEYFTTFENGAAANADKIVSSAVKRVDQGVYDMIELLVQGEPFPGGSLYLMDASVDGITFAPAHDADIPEDVVTRTQDVLAMLASGELTTGVDPITGDLMGGQ